MAERTTTDAPGGGEAAAAIGRLVRGGRPFVIYSPGSDVWCSHRDCMARHGRRSRSRWEVEIQCPDDEAKSVAGSGPTLEAALADATKRR